MSPRSAKDSFLVVPAIDRSAIVIRGKDRTSWLNGLITQDLARLPPGHAAYGLLVEKKGKIQTDLYVVPGEDALAVAVPSGLRDGLVETLDHYLIMEDAELVATELGFWFVHGPRAADLVVAVEPPFAGTLDLLGTGGAVFAGPPDLAATIEEAARGLGGAIGDDAAWEALRIERGLPRFGVEVDTSLYPQEASLETLGVSFQKGCYLGQEVVYMLQERGHVKKKLVPLELEDGDVPAKGVEVTTSEGEVVGDVRSAALGPLGGKAVAIAMVKWGQSKPGTELRVGGHAAKVR